MTFFEKLAEKVGVKETVRSMFDDCPCTYFTGLSECCPEHRSCSTCWNEDWKGQEFKYPGSETAIYPGDIVAVETEDGFKIGRVKKADKFVEVWTDQTNVAETAKREYVHKIVNAYVITGEVLGGTDEEVEKGLRDAYKS